MADHSKIEWTDATWQPITGCSVVSPGCTNCYAMKLAGTRLKDHPSRAGLTRDTKAGPVWTGEVRFNEQWLTQPLHWRKPRRIFVCAHGDLFHESVPDAWIDRVFAVMALAPQHSFQVLTKRSRRMREYMRTGKMWPLPNVWLGVSAEDQTRADERIPDLLATPAAVRWVSAEPLLGPIDFENVDYYPFMDILRKTPRPEPQSDNWPMMKYDVLRGHMKGPDDINLPKLDWIVVGSESGDCARPCNVEWVLSIKDQCTSTGVPFFWKQHVENGRKTATPMLDGQTWTQYPEAANG